MFSNACEYAIRAVLYIGVRSIHGSRSSIPEIAQEIDSPIPFTGKILQNLVRKRIITSSKGPGGGFYLKPDAKPIPISAVIKAIDGEEVLHTCSMGLKECSDKFPCPIHHEIKEYKDRLKKIMKERTIQELAQELVRGKTFLKIDKALSA